MNWEEIREDWQSNNIPLQKLADKHGVSLSAVKSRKSREKWKLNATATKSRKGNKKLQPKKEEVAEKVASQTGSKKKKSSSNGNRKGIGNPNPKNQFTKRNQAARKHGLFSKIVPEETLELAKEMDKINPADMLWDQIVLQYAAIVRAQQIMFVQDNEDHNKFLIERGDHSDRYEMHTAWDKQAKFMAAQTRATSELRNLIKQYVAIVDESDERKLKLELMQANVDKTKIEIEIMNEGDQSDEAHTIVDTYLQAVGVDKIKDIYEDDTDGKET